MDTKQIFDFDTIVDRRKSDSHKWQKYGPEILPLWIADMDFASPPQVIEALRDRVDHGVFGLPTHPPQALSQIVVDMMAERYDWEISVEDLIYLSGTHDSFKLACRMIGNPGDGVLMQTPIYPPLLLAPGKGERFCQTAPLCRAQAGSYSVDFDALEKAITDRTRLFILCHPHNPTGHVFTTSELAQMAEICLRHDLVICSDDVHYDLVYEGSVYQPLAALSPEIAMRTITLFSPSKAYNLPGLKLSIAIVQDKEIRERIRGQLDNYPASIFGIVGATAAYEHGAEWHRQLLAYLQANRDFLYEMVNERLPGISMAKPEATYLAWLDCRQAGLPTNPYQFFLQEAQVALGDGRFYGPGGDGFVRLNFGCPRSILLESLQRMAAALG